MGCAQPHPFHWEDVRSKPAELVLKNPGVEASPDGDGYTVGFLNSHYRVNPFTEKIFEVQPNPERDLTEGFQILLLQYLLAEYGGPEENLAVSDKDLPGGVLFFQGPHALPVEPITQLFGNNPDVFEQRALELGATRVEYSDRGMKFYPFPEIPVTYLLWAQDEEFPASVSVLFDRTVTRWFTLDMVFTMAVTLTERVVEKDGVYVEQEHSTCYSEA